MINATSLAAVSGELAISNSNLLLGLWQQSSWSAVITSTIVLLLGLEYVFFQRKSRGELVQQSLVFKKSSLSCLGLNKGEHNFPLLGSLIPMVRDPYRFWHTMFARGGSTAFSLFGLFCVKLNEAATVRKVFDSASANLTVRTATESAHSSCSAACNASFGQLVADCTISLSCAGYSHPGRREPGLSKWRSSQRVQATRVAAVH